MSSKNGSQAVERALRLLKLFSDDKTTLTVNEAVSATKLNRTTVFRLLNALTNEGFLTRLPSGGYGLGAELTALGSYAQRSNALWQAARPEMEVLRDGINERVTLEVLSTAPDGTPAMLVMDELSADHVLNIREFAGNHLPIHATSTGKVILAFSSAEIRTNLLNHQLKQLTEQTLNSAELINTLDNIRKQGHAIANEELEAGLIAMSAPIFDATGCPIAALSVALPAVRMSPDRQPKLIDALTHTTRIISRRLGFRKTHK